MLNTRGVTRVEPRGDLGGLADMEESLEIAERLSAVEGMIRGYKNLGSTLAELGDLRRAVELERRGVEVARRFGIEFQLVWFETELGILAYLDGDWDAADEAFAPPRPMGGAGRAALHGGAGISALARRSARPAAIRAPSRHRSARSSSPAVRASPGAVPDARRRRADRRDER